MSGTLRHQPRAVGGDHEDEECREGEPREEAVSVPPPALPSLLTDQTADHQPLETEVVHMIDQSQEGLCISLAVNEELTSNNVPYHSTRMRHPRFENVQDGCYHVCPD